MITPEVVPACHHHDLFYLGPLIDGLASAAVMCSVLAEELAAHP